MKIGKLKRALFIVGSLLVIVACVVGAWLHHLGKVHRHCMKIAGFVLTDYAREHGGVFPFHTNGFGDALLLVAREDASNVPFICGPGDDGQVFSNALAHALHVPEAQCSRVYVQGLTDTNNSGICILFDRRSVPGGDHFYGSGRPIREVCLIDGSMQVIPDGRWAEFSRQQVELLIEAGFTREKAQSYYPEAASRK